VDAAQLAQGVAIRWIEPSECPVDFAGGLEIQNSFFQDLAETEEDKRLLGRVFGDLRCAEPLAIQVDKGLPTPIEKEMFFECFESPAIIGIACEDLVLRVETCGQGSLSWARDGVFRTVYRHGTGRA
jgi:hypothetical protein